MVFVGLIVFQPDLGTAIACAAITVCILFVAGLDLQYLGYALSLSLLPLYFLIFPCRLSPRPHSGLSQSLFRSAGQRLPHYSVADCGQYRRHDRRRFDGRKAKAVLSARAAHGLHLFRDCARSSDWSDRLIVVLLFAIFLWRGIRTALHTQDMFGRFLAVGITSMVVVQAFINISVVLGLMPTKGIPLPLYPTAGRRCS